MSSIAKLVTRCSSLSTVHLLWAAIFGEEFHCGACTGQCKLQLGDCAPGFFDLGARTLAKAVCADLQLNFQFAVTQDDDWLLDIFNQMGSVEAFGSHLCPGFEGLRELVKIDFLILDAEDIGKAAFEGQTAHQRELTTFKVWGFDATRTRMLSFAATSGKNALPGRNTAPDAASALMCAWI